MQVLENLQKIVIQEEISDEELAECRKTIYGLLTMENKGEALPIVPTVQVTFMTYMQMDHSQLTEVEC